MTEQAVWRVVSRAILLIFVIIGSALLVRALRDVLVRCCSRSWWQPPQLPLSTGDRAKAALESVSWRRCDYGLPGSAGAVLTRLGGHPGNGQS